MERKVKLSPVFSTKEQEELFAKCAQESMNTKVELIWEGKHNIEKNIESEIDIER